MAYSKPTPSIASRYNHLENQVAGLVAQFSDFIRDSKDHRDRIEKDQTQIWGAIREQGEQLRSAIEKLSTKGQISWPMIVATVGLILSVSAAAAAVGQVLMESRMKQLEITTNFLHELGRENHNAIRSHEQQSAMGHPPN